MKILRLEADSFKRLKAVSITPKGDVVQITGRNAQGKTSVLDAIWAALGGAAHLQSQPIRKGATKAKIRLDLGEIIVTRSITEKGSTLTVENAEGLAYKSPQRMLDDLVGALAFDPLAFTRMKARDQFDQLKAIAKVDLDLDALDGANRRDFEKRTDLNREAKTLRAQLDGLPDPGPLPEAMDLAILLEQHQILNNKKTQTVLAVEQRAVKERTLELHREEIERIRASFQTRKKAIEDLEKELAEDVGAEASDLEELVLSIQGVADEISRVQQANAERVVAENAIERRKEVEARAKDTEARAEALTAQMEARTQVKQDAIAKAAVPVPGLGFGEGIVLYNGVPFDQASSAEQLRVSVAIAMAANPKLRVIRIQDGSLLDDTSLQTIADMARDNDMQVWIEQVSNTNSIGIVIEDGEVVAINEFEAQPPAPVSLETMDALRRGEKPTIPSLDLE